LKKMTVRFARAFFRLNEGGRSHVADSDGTRGSAPALEAPMCAERARPCLRNARRPADASQHGAALRLMAGAESRRLAQSRYAFAASFVRVGADHGRSTGDRGSESAWTLQSSGHPEGLLALVQERRNRFGGSAGEESDDGLQKSWTLFGHFRGCSKGKYRIST
jgi:hypothetical protein